MTREIVEQADSGQRLDRWLRQRAPGLGFGQIQKLLRTGQVRVDGRRAKPDFRLEAGQEIRLPPLPAAGSSKSSAKATTIAPKPEEVEALRSRILYRDEAVIAIDKPAGLAVQGGTGQSRHLDGLLDALRFGADERPRLVHRLDKDTSGVLLLGRTAVAARALTAAFRAKDTRKLYWAAVAGVPKDAWGRVEGALVKRHAAGKGERMVIDAEQGKSATTLYYSVRSYRKLSSWLLLAPLTGRTHQLRVHCAGLGLPILGDGKYGGRQAFLSDQRTSPVSPQRLHLHAREIAISHPLDGTTLRIQAPLPDELAQTWKAFGFDTVDPTAKEALLFARVNELQQAKA